MTCKQCGIDLGQFTDARNLQHGYCGKTCMSARIAELEEALKPFASVVDNPEWTRSRLGDDGKFHDEIADIQPVSMDDCKRAGEVLRSKL